MIKSYLRWKISYDPHADGTERGDTRDAGEWDACPIAFNTNSNMWELISNVEYFSIPILYALAVKYFIFAIFTGVSLAYLSRKILESPENTGKTIAYPL